MAGAGRGDAGFDGSVGFLAGADAIEEIGHVIDGAVAEGLGFEDRIVLAGDAFAIEAEAGASDFESGVGAAKFEAAIVDGRSHHAFVDDVEAGIAEESLDGVRAFPLLEHVFVAEHVDVLGLIGFHGPVSDVDPVGEEIGHGAAAEIPIPTPAMEFFGVEGLIGSAAEPGLPIESLKLDGLTRPVRLVVLPPVGTDLKDAADAAALDEFDGVAEVGPTALLHAALENAVAGADGAGECGAFFEGVGDRLFEVDVLASGEGVVCHADVPVVGRGDEDSVERLVEDLAVVGENGGEAVGAEADGVPMRAVDVADGSDLVAADGIGRREKSAHAAASADDADAKGVVGAENASGGESGESSGDDEAATIELV